MRFAFLLLIAVCVSGCRKKSNPLFYQLDAEQQVLLASQGDDGFDTPEMASIIARLQALPESASEKERATELAAKLTAGQARVKAERALAAAAKAPRPPPSIFDPAPSMPSAPSGPRRQFLCEWSGSQFKGCVLGSFASKEQAEAACRGGLPATERSARCSCGDGPSPVDVALCEQMIAENKKRGW